MVKEEYLTDQLEEIKISTKKLLNFTQRLYLDLFAIISLDETIADLWGGDSIFSGKSYNGEQ